MIRITFILLLIAGVTGCVASNGNRADEGLPPGSGAIRFEGLPGITMRAFYHRPEQYRTGSPILIVMHGVKRNADWYRDAWRPLSEQTGVLIVAPEFSRQAFPGGRSYNRGGMRQRDGKPAPADEWSFTAVERLFDAVRRRTGSSKDSYLLFGHSAGAQFVHRMMTFLPELRVKRAVAANAGWYAMPGFAEKFPHGLGDSGIGEEQLRRAFRRNLVVMLGDADIDPNGRYLNRSAGAMRQGVNRFSRGLAYFDAAKMEAARLDVPLNWVLQIVPGAGHSTHQVKEAALRALMQQR